MRDFLPMILAILFVALALLLWVVWASASVEIKSLKKSIKENTFRIAQNEHVEWTASNCQELRKFYANETGQKLVKICGSHITIEAMKECAGDKGSPQAYGMDCLLRFQFNLASDTMLAQISPPPASQEENTADTERESGEPVEIRRSF